MVFPLYVYRMAELQVSVVIPVYNEEQNLPELLRRTADAMQKTGRTYEVILIDDGSRDKSLPILKETAEKDSHIVVVELQRNFGQHSALMKANPPQLKEIKQGELPGRAGLVAVV